MNWLDVIVLLAAAGAGAGGYHIGLVTRAVSWLGLAVGLFVMARLLPTLLDGLEGRDDRLLVLAALGLLALGASLGQAAGLLLGSRLRRRTRHGTVRMLDSLGGALAGVLAVFVALWLLTPTLAVVPGFVARQARTSAIARAVTEAFPDPPDGVAALRRLVGNDVFPDVFAGLRPAPDLGDPPQTSNVAGGHLIAQSVVKVVGAACGRLQEGTGFVVADDVVVTNAHVVAGEDETVLETQDGRRVPARLVAFDAARDVAVLRTSGLGLAPLPLVEGGVGDEGAVFGHPEGGPLRLTPFAIAREVHAVGRDLYDTTEVEREVLFLAARLRPGDSGAPLVRNDGQVVGMAFAVAPDRETVAYGLTPREVRAVLDTAGEEAIAAGRCVD